MAAMTRGEFARQLAIKYGYDLFGGEDSGFTDTSGSPYERYISALKAAGVVTGTSASTFDPYAPITREQAATMIGRAYDITGDRSSFTDVAAGHYASSYIAGLQDAEIFNGIGGNEFGTGQTFSWENWNAVSGRIDSYVTSTTPVSTSSGTIGTVNNNADAGSSGDDDDDVDIMDSFDWAEQYIADEFDLPGMGSWVREMVEKHGAALTPDLVDVELRSTDQFDTRFGTVIAGRNDADLNAMSPREILDYETTVRQIMRMAGMPPGFYDEYEDLQRLMVLDMSPIQVEERIQIGFERVAMAPIEIRQAYADFYGVQGDEALAAYLLDPTVATPVLERQVITAEVAGTGRQFDLNITQQRAAQLAGIGIDQRLAFTGFSRLSAIAPLFEETFGETNDLVAENEGVDAALLGQGDAQRAIDRRTQTRTNEFAGGGGAATTQAGIIGLGSA